MSGGKIPGISKRSAILFFYYLFSDTKGYNRRQSIGDYPAILTIKLIVDRHKMTKQTSSTYQNPFPDFHSDDSILRSLSQGIASAGLDGLTCREMKKRFYNFKKAPKEKQDRFLRELEKNGIASLQTVSHKSGNVRGRKRVAWVTNHA